jgi:hypothetical protein
MNNWFKKRQLQNHIGIEINFENVIFANYLIEIGFRTISKAINTITNVFQFATFFRFLAIGIFTVLGGRKFVEENTKYNLDFGELLFLLVLGLAVPISISFLDIFRLLYGDQN